jgi:hypothetical protein
MPEAKQLTLPLMNPFRKFLCVPFILIITQMVLTGQAPAGKVQQKVLFSIGKGEKPFSNGSVLALSPIGTSVTLLTSDDEGRVYLYADGKKRGPFNDIADTRITLPEDNPDEYDPVLRRDSDPDYEKYIQYDDAGSLTLKFEGKSFGPFQFILEFYTTADKKSFSAIVMKDGKPQIITSSGNSYVLDGQPAYSYVSSSGKKMMVTIVKENTGENIRPPEAFIWFQDGRKYGPYDPKKINANNPSFNKTGGENWLLTMDSKLFINGTFVRDLINEFITPANIWLSEDGKRYVIIVYNRIEFSDGAVYKDPLKIRISVNRNKITVWWLLENDKDIVLYSRTI